jgi:hypothetical protein
MKIHVVGFALFYEDRSPIGRRADRSLVVANCFVNSAIKTH